MHNVAVLGATGRVGSLVVTELKQAGIKVYSLASKSLELPQDINVIIDFSVPEATLHYLPQCLQYKIPMLIGTTGFTDMEVQKIKQAATRLPILLAANTSLGVNVCYGLLDKITPQLQPNFKIEIEETHRVGKRDKPSGTAKLLAEKLKRLLQRDIPIHSKRVADTVGEHKLIWQQDGETLTLSHKVTNRKIFASGAITAARWLIKQAPGFYNMQNMLQS